MSRIRTGVVFGLALGLVAIPYGWAQSNPTSLPGQKGGANAPQKPEKAPPGQKGQDEKSADQDQGAAVAVEIASSIPPEDRNNLKAYWAVVQSKTGQRWQHAPAAKTVVGSDAVKITGWIHTDGRVTGLAVEHGSGKTAIDRAAMAAISGSAPFEPFPYGIAVDQVKVRFTFGSSVPAPGTPGGPALTPIK